MFRFIYAAEHQSHRPGTLFAPGGKRASRDTPARIDAIVQALDTIGVRPKAPLAHPAELLQRVHSERYLSFLQSAWERWCQVPGAGEALFANVFATRQFDSRSYPECVVGQSAFHFHDQLAPVGPRTWQVARMAADVALTGAGLVKGGEQVVYSLCRPPGHHAGFESAGGAAYLNNAALAVELLRERFERVAILDVDVHHGNGTQEIFYERADVLFVSLHRDPKDYHPFFCGYAHETGSGAGLGWNLNIPLSASVSDIGYLLAAEIAMDKIQSFAPGALVVSLGFDAHHSDPAAGLRLTDAGFAALGRLVRALNVPTLLVQEGGYNEATVGATAVAFLSGVLDADFN